MGKASAKGWLLFFYGVPSSPVGNRMKIWRKLGNIGAVQLKGSVYILPATEEHEEIFQWLISEVRSMGGDGAFVQTTRIEPVENVDIRNRFIGQIEKEYYGLEKHLDSLERKVQSIRKGTTLEDGGALASQSAKLSHEFDSIYKRDFFFSKRGIEMKSRLRQIAATLKSITTTPAKESVSIPQKQINKYQGRIWITRKHPFVDRMASAWLIKKFIDPAARFQFADERDLKKIKADAVIFDAQGGEFTHQRDLCTFEMLVKAFNIRDNAVRKIAEIVHDLDVKDEKYGNSETPGVEEILIGIRKSSKDDSLSLEAGMSVFEMMYLAKS